MMKKQIALLLTMMASASITHAAPVCFKDETTYNEVKSQLPKLLQTTPLVLTSTEHLTLKASLMASFVKGAIHVQGVAKKGLNPFPEQDSGYATEVCADGNAITIKRPKQPDVVVEMKNGVATIQDYNFRTGSVATFHSTKNQILGVVAQAPAPTNGRSPASTGPRGGYN